MDDLTKILDFTSIQRRKEVIVSKWRALPSLYWSLVVGILTVFSVLQSTALSSWTPREVVIFLAVLLVGALIIAVWIASKQKTITERLATASALFAEARRRFGERDYEGAEVAAERSIGFDDCDSRVWNLLGRIRIRLGDGKGSVEALGKALSVNMQPDWVAIYHHNRGVAYLLCRDFGKAKRDFNKCLAEKPRSSVRLRWRSLCSYYINDFEAALRDALSCVKEAPTKVSGQAVLGVIALSSGASEYVNSLDELLRNLKPEEAEDYYYLAAYRLLQGSHGESARLLAIAIHLDDKIQPRFKTDPIWDAVREDHIFRDV
jgi:tetratricopeptide (TPR) repeat protein